MKADPRTMSQLHDDLRGCQPAAPCRWSPCLPSLLLPLASGHRGQRPVSKGPSWVRSWPSQELVGDPGHLLCVGGGGRGRERKGREPRGPFCQDGGLCYTFWLPGTYWSQWLQTAGGGDGLWGPQDPPSEEPSAVGTSSRPICSEFGGAALCPLSDPVACAHTRLVDRTRPCLFILAPGALCTQCGLSEPSSTSLLSTCSAEWM